MPPACCGGGRRECECEFGPVSVHDVLKQPLTTADQPGFSGHTLSEAPEANPLAQWCLFPETGPIALPPDSLLPFILMLFISFCLCFIIRSLRTMPPLDSRTYRSLALALSRRPLLITW